MNRDQIETVAREAIEMEFEKGNDLSFTRNDIRAISKAITAAFMEYESQKK